MESYGLVLAGGGAKGIYQIGAWKALRELEVPLQRVVGTSVGAMNGALVVLDEFDGAVDLWKNMSIEKGFQLPNRCGRRTTCSACATRISWSRSCGGITGWISPPCGGSWRNWWTNPVSGFLPGISAW